MVGQEWGGLEMSRLILVKGSNNLKLPMSVAGCRGCWVAGVAGVVEVRKVSQVDRSCMFGVVWSKF